MYLIDQNLWFILLLRQPENRSFLLTAGGPSCVFWEGKSWFRNILEEQWKAEVCERAPNCIGQVIWGKKISPKSHDTVESKGPWAEWIILSTGAGISYSRNSPRVQLPGSSIQTHRLLPLRRWNWGPEVMVQACNPSYSGGGDWEDLGSRTALVKSQ
jgi:hypothetical protein